MANIDGNILIYQNEKGDTKVDVYFNGESVWMTQKGIAELYQTSPQNITLHIKNIYKDGELQEEVTCKNYLQVQKEGSRQVQREVKIYNLQMILAIGYRVRNNIGMHFRNWASSVLEEYMRKGFAMNDERLKNPKKFGEDYFDELLERIRDIRASEKRMYLNKLHYSIRGHTAAELIVERADASKDNMGLTSFKGAKVRKTDVTIAKNYLNHDEISGLNRVVTMYLDYAEDQARQHIPMYMKDWEEKLNAFLQFTGRNVLENSGSITKKFADEIAIKQYNIFDKNRRKKESEIFDELPELPEIRNV